jgi:hypothetical protein
MKKTPMTRSELDEHMNRRDELVFDYLVDTEKAIYVEEMRDIITDVVKRKGVTYAVGEEVQHPSSKYAYAPWYDIKRMFPQRPKAS